MSEPKNPVLSEPWPPTAPEALPLGSAQPDLPSYIGGVDFRRRHHCRLRPLPQDSHARCTQWGVGRPDGQVPKPLWRPFRAGRLCGHCSRQEVWPDFLVAADDHAACKLLFLVDETKQPWMLRI